MTTIPKPDFTLADLLAECAMKASEEEVGGMTVEEMATQTGMSKSWVREQLRREIATGKVQYIGDRDGKSINGRGCRKPVYKMNSPDLDKE